MTRSDLYGKAREMFGGRGAIITLGLAASLAAVWVIASRDSAAHQEEQSRTSAPTSAGRVDSIVRLDTTAQRLADIQVISVAPNATSGLVANGTITYDANRVSIIAPRVEARVINVRVDLGQAVRGGTTLATLESIEIGQIRGDLERARANADIAQRNFDREKRLYEEQITPQKELLEAEGALKTAQADFNSALAKLRAVGAAGGSGATFGLSTPVAGTVVERNASPGQSVGPSTTLFIVADLRRVWITVDVYEGDLARVRQGALAAVVPTAFPNESFPGRVTYAGGVVDSASHTFKVRVEVENATRRLRPGMFGQVRIETPTTGGTGAIAVPEIAVQDLNGRQIVFVAGREPGTYVARPVNVGSRAGNGLVVIASGLTVGERVVTKGAFQLKAELTKASVAGEG